MNYEFNLLHHVGVVAKIVRAAAETAHEGDDNTPSGPTGRGVKTDFSGRFNANGYEAKRRTKQRSVASNSVAARGGGGGERVSPSL